MKYLVIDASLNGTGIRDYYLGGYINPNDLGLSDELKQQLRTWLDRYADAHYDGFTNQDLVDDLDREGKKISAKIKKELVDVKVHYFSDAKMTKELIV